MDPVAGTWGQISLAPWSDVAQNRPCFGTPDAERIAEELYRIRARAVELPSERDRNFYLREESGRQFVLKIASAADSREVLDLQNRALSHIAETRPDLLVPRVCRTIQGEEIASVRAAQGREHRARMLTYIPARLLAEFSSQPPALLRSLGQLVASIDLTLSGFSHSAAHRELKWDLREAGTVIRAGLPHIEDASRRGLLDRVLGMFEDQVVPNIPQLRASVVHNDGNDHNILVVGRGAEMRAAGILDFGDILHGLTAGDLAIACAYAILGKRNLLTTARHVVAGYNEVFRLQELELQVLFPLIAARLATSVCVSALQQESEPENRYLSVSERPAWEALEKLGSIHPNLAHCTFRDACGLVPSPKGAAVAGWMEQNRSAAHPIVRTDLRGPEAIVFDLSVASSQAGDPAKTSDPIAFTDALFNRMKASGANVGIGRYNEARSFYTAKPFETESDELPEMRTVHIGIDLFLEEGSPVFTPWAGKVHSFQNNAKPLDYGPTIILEHEMGGGRGSFFTLYGHLSEDSLEGLRVGKSLRRGSRIGKIGDTRVNGGWPPHVHFQIIADILGKRGDFPGVATPGERNVWLSLCPDPGLLLGFPDSGLADSRMSASKVLEARRQRIGRNLSSSYRKPLLLVRGYMQHLYDDAGRRYLDAVNNVAHVGHCHPRVVRAASEQIGVLNTNTRYLHEYLVRYADRLTATLPEPLRVCFFVCSGSEANDLALRIAHAHTRQRDVIVVDGAYHGNLSSLIDISPFKFNGPGGEGPPAHVHKVPMPDPYRGAFKSDEPACGEKYSDCVRLALERVQAAGRNPAAFICESALGCGGQIILPPGYLKPVYRHVRSAGGVCIADEVQVGFGRFGIHFWGFQTQEVVPDIVTMGKPIGNGHPLAAVVTTPEIAASFDNGMEYFNTFGGNAVSCAVGLAVLDVICDEQLQQNALHLGARLKTALEQLKNRHALIGDVRGLGLFIGVELVRDHATLEPAADEASYVVERMKDLGILIGSDGPCHNVIKIKPPLVFTAGDVDRLIEGLDRALTEL